MQKFRSLDHVFSTLAVNQSHSNVKMRQTRTAVTLCEPVVEDSVSRTEGGGRGGGKRERERERERETHTHTHTHTADRNRERQRQIRQTGKPTTQEKQTANAFLSKSSYCPE